MPTPAAARRLTEYSHGAGCGCKLGPGQLNDVLDGLAPSRHPDLIVGTDTGDDAAVWRLSDDRALVVTADFFTPVVDDAYTWGRVAAQNAVSDVWAMGGRPLLALNLVAWPSAELPTELLVEVLAGGAEIATQSGFAIAGGHSVDDPEPKYGLAVVGEVHPDRILTNSGLRDGDVLVLTKPLGVGIATTAIKRRVAPAGLVDVAIEVMTASNGPASAVALAVGARGATDVTGFGLLGHVAKMARASGVDVVLDVAAVPMLPGVRQLAADGVVPGGSRRNLQWVEPMLDPGEVDETDVTVLADAQTSGGLVFGATAEGAESAVAALGGAAAIIGTAHYGSGRIQLQ